ncbi:hypothetical protein Dimus_004581 [Dionaea muscipula]
MAALLGPRNPSDPPLRPPAGRCWAGRSSGALQDELDDDDEKKRQKAEKEAEGDGGALHVGPIRERAGEVEVEGEYGKEGNQGQGRWC